jgi:hypothetical protein
MVVILAWNGSVPAVTPLAGVVLFELAGGTSPLVPLGLAPAECHFCTTARSPSDVRHPSREAEHGPTSLRFSAGAGVTSAPPRRGQGYSALHTCAERPSFQRRAESDAVPSNRCRGRAFRPLGLGPGPPLFGSRSRVRRRRGVTSSRGRRGRPAVAPLDLAPAPPPIQRTPWMLGARRPISLERPMCPRGARGARKRLGYVGDARGWAPTEGGCTPKYRSHG